MASPSNPATNDEDIRELFINSGFKHPRKLSQTLQGSIWRVKVPATSSSSSRSVVVKIARRDLCSKAVGLVNGLEYKVCEDIVSEINILRRLTNGEPGRIPGSFVKHLYSFQTDNAYFFFMEDGGGSLFDFVLKAHQLVEEGHLAVAEWQRVVRVIFKQMVGFVEYIHARNVCHFDLSIENMCVNDVNIVVDYATHRDHLTFDTDGIQIKACDFGLAHSFDDAACMSRKYCGKPNYQSPEVSARSAEFSAKSNDVFCLGVCLFMMVLGSSPWSRSCRGCPYYKKIVIDGELKELLGQWKRLDYVDDDLLELFASVFTPEKDRWDLDSLKKCKWLAD